MTKHKNLLDRIMRRALRPVPNFSRIFLVALAAKVGEYATHAQDSDAPPAADHLTKGSFLNLMLEVALVIVGLLLLWKLFGFVKDFFVTQMQISLFSRVSLDVNPNGLPEEDEFSKLNVQFQSNGVPSERPKNLPTAPNTVSAATKVSARPSSISKQNTSPIALGNGRSSFAALEVLCEKLKRWMDKSGQTEMHREILADISTQIQNLKATAGTAELRAVWQVSSALEGLLKQLIDRVSNITPSSLCTVASGVELLDELSSQKVSADFLTNPPIRILAVDDDPVSRFALSAAIKKAFDKPDVAESGEAALAMITQQRYDAIFLDVKMPGMDGYELCSRIRETSKNVSTPVVFVTSLNDFEARNRATSCGGDDFIAKPFLSFEITVKVLTCVLQKRLQELKEVAQV